MLAEQKLLIQKTRDFEEDSPRKSLLLLNSSLFLLLIAYLTSLLSPFILITVFSSLIHGLLIVRLFGIYHDYAHGALLKRNRWAAFALKLFGLYVLTPISVWRRSHNFHHSHNSKLAFSSIGSYPIMSKGQFDNSSKLEKRVYLFSRHPLTILFGYFSIFLFGMSIRPLFINIKEHKDSILALLLHLISCVLHLYIGGWFVFFFAFFIPHFISSMLGSYLFYAQHNFPNAIYKDKKQWNYFDAALSSSSYMKMPKLLHWFTANIGYHHIHHINSKIPFYRLPEVMTAIPEFQSPKETSLAISDIISCLKLKVWDENTGVLRPLKN